MFPLLTEEQKPHYAYVLGLYLGDGCIYTHPRTYRLRIFLNSIKDKEVIDVATKSLRILFPKNKISNYKQLKADCVEVSVYNKHLVEYFPQHGKGIKSGRDVSLTSEQSWVMTPQYVKYLICGLLDSDGCRYLYDNRSNWQLTNKSEDIINTFCEGLDILDIFHTKQQKSCGSYNVFIRRRNTVEQIDSIFNDVYNVLR